MLNVTRPDVVRPSLSPEAALSGAPESEQQRFADLETVAHDMRSNIAFLRER